MGKQQSWTKATVERVAEQIVKRSEMDAEVSLISVVVVPIRDYCRVQVTRRYCLIQIN